MVQQRIAGKRENPMKVREKKGDAAIERQKKGLPGFFPPEHKEKGHKSEPGDPGLLEGRET